MGSKEKLIARLKSKPKDFTFEEVKSLMKKLGYVEDAQGKTSGSRVAFIHPETFRLLRLHKPHPENTLPLYAVVELLQYLERNGEI